MKVYIAGPITGHFDYRKKFKAAEDKLQSMGHTVINPAYLPAGLDNYMPICFAMIGQCEAVFFLSGWTDSVGAKEEWEYAKELGKKMYYEAEEDGR